MSAEVESAEVESTEKVMMVKVRECRTERTIVLSVTEEQLKKITVLQLKKKIQSVFGIPGRIKMSKDSVLADDFCQ